MGKCIKADSGNKLKLFDSIKDSKWVGQNFSIKNGCIIVLKSAKAEQKIDINKESYSIRVVGKKRIGDGTVSIVIRGPDNERILEETFQFTKSSWSEASFDFTCNQKLSASTISIIRDGSMFGSVEIARIIIDSVSKANYTPAVVRKEIDKQKTVNYISHSSSSFIEVRKKIAFIIPYSIYGGAEIYLTNILNEIKEDYNISFIYLQKNNISNFINYKINHIETSNIENMCGYLKTLNFDYIVYYNRLDVYQALEKLVLNKEIQSKLIEIYHSNFIWPGAIALEKNRRAAKLLITVSENLGSDIILQNGTEKKTIPVGINLDKFSFRDKQLIKESLGIKYENIIGTVARLSKEKNLIYLTELARCMPNFNFMILGDGNEKISILDKINQYNLSNVHLIGFKQNPELYYNIFDAFILPSKIEGLPISILESMASGTTVYTTNVGDISSLVKNDYNGYFINLDTKHDSELIASTYKKESIIKQARTDIELNFNIRNNAKIFFDAIFSLDKRYSFYEKEDNHYILPGEYV
jgi:glycosyltransferase involved in cell wall biosynthesis